VRDHEPAAIRLALLAHHYRSSWEFDAEELKLAAERLDAWRRADGSLDDPSAPSPPLPEPVDAALARDLDTVAALGVVDELAAARDGTAVAASAAVLGVALG
jgi:L-cysteine:1D-myo-inositol 2-amino-2-deoxy-alpha-D-glucopyranoside ligase